MNKALSFLLYLIVVLERRMLFGEVKNLFHNRSSTSFATLASHFGTSLACSAQALDQSFLDRELYLYHLDCPINWALRTTFRGFFPYLQQPLWNPLSQRFRAYLGPSFGQ